ncbi:MAG: alkaline phosphatase family protein [Gemmatimonadota bacterium]|nr:alkaline phosphatase family protein [Gemmatimonadota bacterium]MDE3005951.1 alkaline phosphatase family protein [Gemmatimonadota bacterium]MDE3012952.1 alkaline phosphatase family protein [Gemmatimonadota bacterium]
MAGPPLAARGAGLLTRHEESLARGEAVSSEIVNDGWKTHLGHDWLPDITPSQAGAALGRIAVEHDLTLYAHYSTDTAGHRGGMDGAVEALERVDLFLRGLLETLDPSVLLLVTSDHGNIEDVWAGHTSNPALGLLSGEPPDDVSEIRDLRDISPFVLRFLGIEG